MAEFRGFAEEGLRFLDELALNNNKQWFDSHRPQFDEYLLEPAKAYVVEVGARLQERISPGIHAEPRINGSIMRMNRDIRFSKDKSPYKTWFDSGSGRAITARWSARAFTSGSRPTR
jgi:uncharacterized protein (TIGR02453 family)